MWWLGASSLCSRLSFCQPYAKTSHRYLSMPREVWNNWEYGKGNDVACLFWFRKQMLIFYTLALDLFLPTLRITCTKIWAGSLHGFYFAIISPSSVEGDGSSCARTIPIGWCLTRIYMKGYWIQSMKIQPNLHNQTDHQDHVVSICPRIKA